MIEFFRAERALAMERRIRISQEKTVARIAEEAESARQHKKEGEKRIAAKAEKERIAAMEEEEKIMQHKKEDEARSVEEAARIWRHKEEEDEKIRRHEEMCHLRREADNIRTRRMLQEVWKDAEERRREEEDEGECSISVTDRELWRKCFREQEALALEEAEEIRQHKEYRLPRAYERLQWEKEDVAKKAEKTAELQQVMVIKTAEEEVIQHEDVVKIAELQHVKVMMSTAEEARQHKDVVTAAEIQHVTVLKTADKVMQHEEAEKITDDDDEDGRMSEERERNDIGQVRGPSLPAPLVWRTSKMPRRSAETFKLARSHSEAIQRREGQTDGWQSTFTAVEEIPIFFVGKEEGRWDRRG